MKVDVNALDGIIRRDPGGRGVSTFRADGQLLAGGQLQPAAESLALASEAVCIVTGFCIASAQPPAAETDGPPGSLYLARALAALNKRVVLVSDSYGVPILSLGCSLANLSGVHIVEIPMEGQVPRPHERYGLWCASPTSPRIAEHWEDELLANDLLRGLTHLIAIERAGPSHTLESMISQRRDGPPPVEQFEREVPTAERDTCHNMRGMAINQFTAPAHRLFERAKQLRPEIISIGLADGGNEIGMGQIAWEILREAIACGPAGRVACRIATDYLLLAGVSDWAAYALAAATTVIGGQARALDDWHPQTQRELIEALVRQAGAVDGVLGRRQASVDGLSLDDYLAPLYEIGRLCGANWS